MNGQGPVLIRAGVALAVFWIPGGELHFEFRKAKGVEHQLGKLNAAHNFIFNLRRGAEDVGVILGKAADPQQPMHGARTLIAIHIAQLRIANRQIPVALGRILVDKNVEGTVHRLHPVIGVVQLHRREHVVCE